MNFLILEPKDYSNTALSIYRQLGSVYLWGDVRCKANEVDVLITRLGFQIDREFMGSYPRLKVIITPTTGLTHIDEKECSTRGVKILSLRDCSEEIVNVSSTAEHTFGLILAVVRRIPAANNHIILDGGWNRLGFRGHQLASMKIGIIGLGRIGARVARYANAFDMEVCAYDPYRSDEYIASLGARKCTLDELIQQVDIISIHAAYTSGAKNIIGKNEIAKIKRGAVIINTARGELLDLDAAVNALRANMLDGLGLDVLPQENSHDLMATSSFVKAARDGFNIVVTPHLGGCTIEAMTYTEDLIANLFFKNYRFSI